MPPAGTGNIPIEYPQQPRPPETTGSAEVRTAQVNQAAVGGGKTVQGDISRPNGIAAGSVCGDWAGQPQKLRSGALGRSRAAMGWRIGTVSRVAWEFICDVEPADPLSLVDVCAWFQ